MALVARQWCRFTSRERIVNAPASLWAGAFFRIGALYACAGAMCACLGPGARRVGFNVCAGGVNGDLAARETEVRGL